MSDIEYKEGLGSGTLITVKLDQLNQLLKEHEEQQAKLAAKDERIEGLLEAAIASVSRDHANALAAKDAEIERLKGDNARFQSAHDGLLAEIDKLAKHDMAVGTALRETLEALKSACDVIQQVIEREEYCGNTYCWTECLWCDEQMNKDRTIAHKPSCEANAVLAKYAALAGEADHG